MKNLIYTSEFFKITSESNILKLQHAPAINSELLLLNKIPQMRGAGNTYIVFVKYLIFSSDLNIDDEIIVRYAYYDI